MTPVVEAKNKFIARREQLFNSYTRKTNALEWSMEYSLLVEEHIRAVAGGEKYDFTIASAGSFSRRELSPASDIDLMFIAESIDKNKDIISKLVTELWDSGIEVSHTLRDFSDIKKYLKTDLHTFTQLSETRMLLGSEKIYTKWNDVLFNMITDADKEKLLNEMFEDIQARYNKYGDSPKVLEPNVKLSAGGLRDFQSVEWMYIIKNRTQINKQSEITQAEAFIEIMKKNGYTSPIECRRLLESYGKVLNVRNYLHLKTGTKSDRFEFSAQQKIAKTYHHTKTALNDFMREYFKAANVINRFSKSMIKRFKEELSNPLPDSLLIDLDDDFAIKGNTISIKKPRDLNLSEILRACYYRGLHNSFFDENLRSLIITSIEKLEEEKFQESESSVFFREIMKLPKNVGQTLLVMNELGVLSVFMAEFKDLVGFMQHGVYHCYTADEHTLIAIQNVERLEKDTSMLGKLFNSLKDKEILFLGLLFHDIAKPINIGGHEIIGAEMASSIMHRLGYSEEEIEQVTFLVKKHLLMEQVAFRRNLNDPETLNNFASNFDSIKQLDLLYLVTYADLSAVNSAIWTSWKSELLSELYRKTHAMIEEQKTGEELLASSMYVEPKQISKLSPAISETHVQEHFEMINDIAYSHQFSEQEIASHVEEIQKGVTVSAMFLQSTDYTNVTVITKDSPSLLSKLCGVFSINDANIHDAKIFTRKDGIVIDTFNLTDFRSHSQKIDESRFPKIKKDLAAVISGKLMLNKEFDRMKSKWRRIESKFYNRGGKVKVVFEKHEKYTIIDVFSPDRLGFLYKVTSKMNELGLDISFAKISTKGDDIVDSFYVLDRKGKKIPINNYEFIRSELTATINEML